MQAKKLINTIVTHSGPFHADDVFAVTVLKALYPAATVQRSRDPSVWAAADVLVDVGGELDPERYRFDHHQPSCTAEREGVFYASSGLVWKYFGTRYLQRAIPFSLSESELAETAAALDSALVQPLDLADTGQGKPDSGYSTLPAIVHAFNAAWLEPSAEEDTARFLAAVQIVGVILAEVAKSAAAAVLAKAEVLAGVKSHDGNVLTFARAGLPWHKTVITSHPQVLFVVYPRIDKSYALQVVPTAVGTFQARKSLPAAWGGLDREALAGLTGVKDAIFCHKGLFITSAGSLSGTLKLAELALADCERTPC